MTDATAAAVTAAGTTPPTPHTSHALPRPTHTGTSPLSPSSHTGTPRSSIEAPQRRSRRHCSSAGCARVDAGGGYCVAHGGGKKCSYPGCLKGYQTGGFCRAHGGGARCQVDGCTKVDAGRGLCRAHGGGKRCQAPSCHKADVGGGFCTAHGGGRRCSEEGCTKIDQGGGKCRAHGGARRCRKRSCSQPARGASGLCSEHGGAQLCRTPCCRRLAKAAQGTLCLTCAKERSADQQAMDVEMTESIEPIHGRYHTSTAMTTRRTPARGASSPLRSQKNALAAVVHAANKGEDEELACIVQRLRDAQPTEVEPYNPPSVGVRRIQSEVFPPSMGNFNHGDIPMNRAEIDTSEVHGNRQDSSHGRSGDVDAAEPAVDKPAGSGNERGGGCSGAFIGGCLDNGCSRSFGGRCNCTTGCSCCHSPGNATEQDGDHENGPLAWPPRVGSAKTMTTSSSPSPSSSTPDTASPSEPVSCIDLQRFMVTITLDGHSNLPLPAIRACFHSVEGVRSVHLLSISLSTEKDSSIEPMELESKGEASSDATDREEDPSRLVFVLRAMPDVKVAALETITTALLPTAIVDFTITTIAWSWKEVVLRVDEMMCPGNCGRTVVNATRKVPHVHTSNLVFERRTVITRGEMDVKQLCSEIEATGFDAVVEAVTALPRRFLFRVRNLVSMHMTGARLEELVRDVEGVEHVVVIIERAELMVQAMLPNASSILQTIHDNGFEMVEIPEDGAGISAKDYALAVTEQTVAPSFNSGDRPSSAGSNGERHVCDVDECPHTGCSQYMATVAHTAALAVGWVVPGCAMSWGGECTCGEKCKCDGCPQHNPAT